MVRKVFLGLVCLYILAAGVWVVASGFARNEQLLNVACDPTRELWRDVNKAFIADYVRQHGIQLSIRQSHGGSGSQARAVIDGLPADVISLALWTDTDAVRKAGLLDADWQRRFPNRSLPYTSTIVFVVRKGNPKNITDWADLDRDDVEVITPDPKTSGNGKWSFLAMWGSVLRRGGTEADAEAYLTRVFRRVPVLPSAAREATITFAKNGLGHVHLTWENEAILEVEESAGKLEMVYPHRPGERPISVLAEPHVAVVDSVVDRKGTRKTAEAYLDFLYTPDMQRLIAKHHHRPTLPEVVAETRAQFPEMDLFEVVPLCGPSWDAVQERFFNNRGMFDRITVSGRGAR